MREWLRVVATSKNTYTLRFFNVALFVPPSPTSGPGHLRAPQPPATPPRTSNRLTPPPENARVCSSSREAQSDRRGRSYDCCTSLGWALDSLGRRRRGQERGARPLLSFEPHVLPLPSSHFDPLSSPPSCRASGPWRGTAAECGHKLAEVETVAKVTIGEHKRLTGSDERRACSS